MSWPPCEVLPVAVTRGSKSRVPVNQPLTTMSLPALATARISSSLIDPMRKGTGTAGSPGPGPPPPGPVASGSNGPQAASTTSVNSRRFLGIPESIGFPAGRQERQGIVPGGRTRTGKPTRPGSRFIASAIATHQPDNAVMTMFRDGGLEDDAEGGNGS